MNAEVWGLDAETGAVLWKWAPGPWTRGVFRSELERMSTNGGMCIPNPVGNPTLDADGNFYIGMLDGFIYHLRGDADGPGVHVASKYDAEAAFSNGGVSMAPDTMAIASCDSIFVFKGA